MSPQEEQSEIEVLPAGTRPPEQNNDAGRSLQRGRQNIIIGTLNVIADPARGAFIEPIERRYFKHYQPERAHGWRHLIVDTLLAISVVGLVGYNLALYIGFGSSLVAGIRFSIAREGVLVSGTSVTYTIAYTNENRERLERATVVMQLPATLTHMTVEPSEGYNAKTKTWALGVIDAGGTAELRVRGDVLGSINDGVNVAASFSYTPEGSTREERVSASDTGSITSAATLAITTHIPQHVVNGQSITLTFAYANRGAFPIERVVIQPQFPDGFTLERTEPALEKGAFVLDRLAKDGEGKMTIIGTLDGKGQEQVLLPMRVVIHEGTRSLDQGETIFTIPVFYPKLKTTLTIDTPSIHPGEPTTYTVAYENEGSVDILDAMIVIEFPSAFLTPATFVSSAGTLDGSTVRINKKTFPQLALVRAKGKGEATFTVASRATFDQRIVLSRDTAKLPVKLTTQYRIEPDVETIIPNTNNADLPVSAALNLQSFARYYTDEGEQLGRGPLPPSVGKTTRYWIFWNVVNQVNEVRSVVVRGVLPTGVAWTGKVSTTYGDAVKFDAGTNTVLWNVDQVKRETGGIYPDVGASFEVALTPETAAAGKVATLIQGQSIQGQDIVTQETIEKAVVDVTTALPNDPLAKNKGIIRNP
ncbi:MAG: hypothetical protein HZB10_00780 [Candidatus Yonathbacteria bacterium]|nr:hypothetical protein [Candidatus Yonathbacteria bacterium]